MLRRWLVQSLLGLAVALGNRQIDRTVLGECIAQTWAWNENVTCYTVSGNREVCNTMAAPTRGCNITQVTTTTTIPGPAITARCESGSCGDGGCSLTPTFVPTPVCTDCETINGTLIAPYATGLPSSALVGPSAASSSSLAATALTKRTLVQPSDFANFDSFLIRMVENARSGGNVCPLRSDSGRSSSRYVRFGARRTHLAVEGLDGCTAVVVASRRGAWISHWWQSPTFNPNQGESSDFEKDVEVGMHVGDESGLYPGLDRLISGAGSLDQMLFNIAQYGKTNNVVKVLIIHPWLDPVGWPDNHGIKYPFGVERVKRSLRNANYPEPQLVLYKHLPMSVPISDGKRILANTGRGRVVVLYDPTHLINIEVQRGQGGQLDRQCQTQWAAYRVYNHDGTDNPATTPILDDYWLAMPGQGHWAEQQHHRRSVNGEEDTEWSQGQVCRAVSSTVSSTTTSKASSTTLAVTSCKVHNTGILGHPKTTLCDCNDGQTLTATSTTGRTGAITVVCGNTRTTVPVATVAGAAASAIAGILGHRPTSKPKPAPSTVWSTTLLTTEVLPLARPTVTSTMLIEPPASPKWVPGTCAVHWQRRLVKEKDKYWDQVEGFWVVWRVYDRAGKLLDTNEHGTIYLRPVAVLKENTTSAHDITAYYGDTDTDCQEKLHPGDGAIWSIVCAYQKFSYREQRWTMAGSKSIRGSGEVNTSADSNSRPQTSFCNVGEWAPGGVYTQDMDCFFKC